MTWCPVVTRNFASMKLKPVYITIEDEDGNIIDRIPYTAAADDWIRAGRLSEKARAGDEEAARQLKEMEETQMMEVVEDDGEDDEEDENEEEDNGYDNKMNREDTDENKNQKDDI